MRVTKSYIKQLVKEELTKVLSESVPTDSARKLMKYLEHVYILPEDEEEFKSLSASGGGFEKYANFEEFKAKIEKETGEPYAKVLSFYNTMDHHTPFNQGDSIGKHDKYQNVNRKYDKRDARVARMFGTKRAIQSGTLKETEK